MLYQDIVIDPRYLVGVVVVGDVGARALELNLVLAFLRKDSSSWKSYLRLAKFSRQQNINNQSDEIITHLKFTLTF